MTTSNSTAPCANKRRSAAEPARPSHPLFGLQSATRKCKELDQALADRSLSAVDRRELLAQYRAFIRAAATHSTSLLEMSYQRYETLAD